MQGKVLVLLSICVLPVIHDAVQFRPESVNSLCEHNLLQDDAREILEATFDTVSDNTYKFLVMACISEACDIRKDEYTAKYM